MKNHMKTWPLLLVIGGVVLAHRTTTLSAAPSRGREPARRETVLGCPICCCRVSVPKDATIEQAIRECFRKAPKECRDACRAWLQQQDKPTPPKTEKVTVR